MATVLTDSGKATITSRLSGLSQWIAWGTGSGTSSVTDTTLFTEDTTSGYVRVAGTITRVTTSKTNDTLQVVATLTAGANLTITNAGTFDAVSGGNIIVKGDFTGVALSTNDSIQFTVKTQFT